jgi:hypothetical protein
MQEFIAKYKDEIQGSLSGFDRLVFVGAPEFVKNFETPAGIFY